LVEQAAASNATAATVTASRPARPARLPVEVCISDPSLRLAEPNSGHVDQVFAEGPDPQLGWS
jgi:hypothetical protein